MKTTNSNNKYNYSFDELFKNNFDMRNFSDIIQQSVAEIGKGVSKVIDDSLYLKLGEIAETQVKFNELLIENIFKNTFLISNGISKMIQESKKDPNSFFNWNDYCYILSEYLWILPYNMSIENLKDLLENINSEKELDRKLLKYFDNKKVEELCFDISNMLSNNMQRSLFKQIINAYKNKDYALANIGIVSIIDDSLSYFIYDKGCTSRINVFQPIIEDLEKKGINFKVIFLIMMINENINKLYDVIEFNKKIDIKTNKKARRNPMSHGKNYSNKKIDTIMLLNSLYYLLTVKIELRKYKSSLAKNKKDKNFHMATRDEKRKIREKINKKIISNC